ncbi:SDR family NAD(P)-dependent oxidoreductase [Mesorhizobium calcicola]|uniref:SDR family NAD(P)-dependent oxidoreductase n=1 Tax=Mesorhizobium calcicola TaxID=1300310 RepID=A0ABW4WQ03_9HYPH
MRGSQRTGSRDQIETNVFGALWVTQGRAADHAGAALRHIIQISSIGGVNAFASLGLYHASKVGAGSLQPQSLGIEVAEFGIHVTLVEPGGFSTDWAGPSAKVSKAIEAYAPAAQDGRARANFGRRRSRGNPPAMLAIVVPRAAAQGVLRRLAACR